MSTNIPSTNEPNISSQICVPKLGGIKTLEETATIAHQQLSLHLPLGKATIVLLYGNALEERTGLPTGQLPSIACTGNAPRAGPLKIEGGVLRLLDRLGLFD